MGAPAVGEHSCFDKLSMRDIFTINQIVDWVAGLHGPTLRNPFYRRPAVAIIRRFSASQEYPA
jgi:hypothetical protein